MPVSAIIREAIAPLPAERGAALRYREHKRESTHGKSFADAEERQETSVADRQGLGLPEANLESHPPAMPV